MTTALPAAVERLADRIARRRTGVVAAARRGDEVHVAGRGDIRVAEEIVAGRAAGAAQASEGPGRGPVPDAHTLFEIGSITKVFTALLLADGVTRGQWELRTPVSELLPPGTAVPTRGRTEITLAHLATHTSGLPRSPLPLGLADNIAYLRRGADPYAGLTEQDVLDSLGSTRLRRTPGTGGTRYSNFGFGLLGIALSHATGRSYGELVGEQICAPLGLVDTVVEADMTADQHARMAVGHRSRRRTAAPWPLLGIAGAGALRSTAADLLTVLEAQQHPAATPLADAIRLTHRTPPGGPSSMGLGWHRAGDDGYWHNGGTGGFRTIVAFRGAATVIVLINQSKGADLRALGLLNRLA